MDTCDWCHARIQGDTVKVIDGHTREDGEFEHQNTWTYHATCVKIGFV